MSNRRPKRVRWNNHQGLQLGKLPIKNVEIDRKGKVDIFVIDHPNKNKKVALHPTKGFRVSSTY